MGEAEIVKAGLAVAVTVSDTDVVCVMPPPVPLMVTVYVPVAVEEATVKVIRELPAPGDAMEAGLKPTVTPVGSPDAVSAMAEAKPPETAVEIVDVPLLP